MTHPIPSSALTGATAIIGRSGSGKSYTARGVAERLLEEGCRVCVIDPTGAWWGLRRDADGGKGYEIAIFGGDHADVQITAKSGQALGTLVAEANIPSIIDISDMSNSEQTRFLTDFCEALYLKNRLPLHFIMDEADVMVPQQPLPEQQRLKGAVNKIVRRGRIRGFRPMMITQRPAVIDKSVLSQIGTLVAMRLTSPQDRKAVEEWVKGNADSADAKAVMSSLPGLAVGEGWVWSPADDILKRVKFPPNRTHDSSRAPEIGEENVEPFALDSLDLSAIETALAPEEEEEVPKKASAGEIKAAEQRGYERGLAEGYERGKTAGIGIGLLLAHNAIGELRKGQDDPSVKAAIVPPEAVPKIKEALEGFRPVLEQGLAVGGFTSAKPGGLRGEHRNGYPAPKQGSKSSGAALSPTAQKILDIIKASYPVALTYRAAALRAGASPRSSAFRKYEAEIVGSGEVEEFNGRLRALEGGDVPAPAGNPVEIFIARLQPSYGRMLRAIADHGPLTREQVAARASVSPTSSGLTAGLNELVAMEIVERRGNTYSLAEDLR